MLDPPLHVLDGETGVALVPAPVEVLGDGPELHDQIVREILRLDLSALLPPQTNEVGLVAAHDYPGIRSAKERTAIPNFQLLQHSRLQRSMLRCYLCSLHM